MHAYSTYARNPKNETALQAVETFAAALAARFSPVIGCTRSWDAADPDDFPVIIDNMMNLEVLFDAADLTGNQTLRQIAVSHADRTMMDHVRADGADSLTYTPTCLFVTTLSQGHRSTSSIITPPLVPSSPSAQLRVTPTRALGVAAKRGVFTALPIVRETSGYLIPHSCHSVLNLLLTDAVYRRTRLVRYLVTARRMAEYFLNNIPADGIIPWDFNAPLVPPRPADSSAAMIAANGLLLLAQQERSLYPANQSGASYFANAAIKVHSPIRVVDVYGLNIKSVDSE